MVYTICIFQRDTRIGFRLSAVGRLNLADMLLADAGWVTNVFLMRFELGRLRVTSMSTGAFRLITT